jgi:hypothetical protein
MKFGSILLILLSLTIDTHAISEELYPQDQQTIDSEERKGIFEIGFVLGSSELSIDKEYTISQDRYSRDTITIGIELGYRWPENYLIETSFTTTVDFDVFGISDNYELYQWNTLVGYSIPISDRVRLIPKIGISRWELDATEGALFNPGPELELEFNDIDLTYQLAIEFPVLDELNLELAYENTRYSFGEVKIVNFGFSFEF